MARRLAEIKNIRLGGERMGFTSFRACFAALKCYVADKCDAVSVCPIETKRDGVTDICDA